ncbi:hypothetical protein WR25_03559 [Diploscapter pachys]|uniref:Uncharacterized protein n=1 Tax=Diploscapter pachys TaxID=2018661 RepID=A0A2A2K4H0_9BILA|nr:hypothetical protein WR25_03559 [Diploscapter pachys]
MRGLEMEIVETGSAGEGEEVGSREEGESESESGGVDCVKFRFHVVENVYSDTEFFEIKIPHTPAYGKGQEWNRTRHSISSHIQFSTYLHTILSVLPYAFLTSSQDPPFMHPELKLVSALQKLFMYDVPTTFVAGQRDAVVAVSGIAIRTETTSLELLLGCRRGDGHADPRTGKDIGAAWVGREPCEGVDDVRGLMVLGQIGHFERVRAPVGPVQVSVEERQVVWVRDAHRQDCSPEME